MLITAPIYKKQWYNGVIREKDDSSDYAVKHPRSSHEKEKLKLDKIMQKLFKLSDNVTLDLINSLFDESFSSNEVTLHYDNNEFINDAYDRIVGDLYITLETEGRRFNYHMEFQTLNDESMVIRMFRYGFEKAVELAKPDKTKERTIITLPKQLVIFLEKNEAIHDVLSFTLRLPDGTELDYTVPVMKYWTYSTDELINRSMFALLPLQVFQSRKAMKAIHESSWPDTEKRRLMNLQFKQLEQTIRRIIEVLGELDGSGMTIQELDGILSAQQHLTEYLYSHYGGYITYEKEVQRMIESFIDPRIMEEGKREGIKEGKREGIKEGELKVAKRLLDKGLKVNEVAELTDLTLEEIQNL